jgi:hypothetical protein
MTKFAVMGISIYLSRDVYEKFCANGLRFHGGVRVCADLRLFKINRAGKEVPLPAGQARNIAKPFHQTAPMVAPF